MLTSEIASMMPGTLHVTENYFVWTDPMSVQNQAHVLDKATAEEVGSLIDIGQGPEEYIAPIYTVGEGEYAVGLRYQPEANRVLCLG